MSRFRTSTKTWFSQIDWRLLVFLVLVLDVKFVVKIAAVLLIYLLRPDFRFGLSLRRPSESRIPPFYFILPVIAVLDWVFRRQFALSQDALLAGSLVYWAMSILIFHQLRLFAGQGDPTRIHRTITLFFLLNCLVSLYMLADIMITTGAINPYHYLGEGQQFYISTGDHIQGVTFDFSLTNALINAFGIVYFVQRKQYGMMLACMVVLLLTGSNLTDLIIALVLVILFFYHSPKMQKVVTAACLILLALFMKFVSPENKNYATQTIAAIAEHKVEIAAVIKTDTNYHVPTKEVVLIKKAAAMEEDYHFQPTPEQARFPGKVISYQQTVKFLLAHPWYLPLGTGAGHFSSKLAFKASALGTEGGYPASLVYIDPDFRLNHLALFLYYFTKGNQHHSIIHTPFSVYNQTLGEYGLAGLAALAVFYFGFFIRRMKKGVYGWMMLGILAASLTTDYWFEQLSIVIVFELLWLAEFRSGGEPRPQS